MTLDTQISEWRTRLGPATSAADLDELESHLRDQVDDLRSVGLDDEEAFLIAVKRIGGTDDLSREYAREHSGRLWKQLLPPDARRTSGLGSAVGFAVGAAIVVQVLIGSGFEEDPTRFLRNGPAVTLGFLAAWFAVRRGLGMRPIVVTAIPFALGLAAVNLYPWAEGSDTELLAVACVPVALWFALALPYMQGRWRDHGRRMDFIRFTGEWVIYYALIAIGGGILTALTAVLVDEAIAQRVLLSGAAGAVVIAAWLVESKQSVVENMAPVLTAVFTPLFAVLLVVATIDHLAGGLAFDRDALAIYDALLVVVVGLVLYSISARDPADPAGWSDRLQLVAVAAAVVLDGLVLGSMLGRVGDLGVTPNRVATLSLNVVLLVNLGWAAWLSIRFVSGRSVFHPLERWQTSYLPAYGLWAAGVVLALPLAFSFA
jgi:hypothetical protein